MRTRFMLSLLTALTIALEGIEAQSPESHVAAIDAVDALRAMKSVSDVPIIVPGGSVSIADDAWRQRGYQVGAPDELATMMVRIKSVVMHGDTARVTVDGSYRSKPQERTHWERHLVTLVRQGDRLRVCRVELVAMS